MNFSDEEREVVAEVDETLRESIVAAIREETRRQIADLEPHEMSETVDPEELSLIEEDMFDSNRYYAIHNDDLKFWKASVGATAAISAGLKNPIGVAAGLVLFLYEKRKKQAELDGMQGLVLKTLKSAPVGQGWSVEQIVAEIPLVHEFRGEWTADRLKEILGSLKAVALTNGVIAEFVIEKDGKFWARDV